MNPNVRIGDLIEVPPVRTVIRLEEGRSSAGEVAASFVFTPEVSAHLAVIAEALGSGRGQGYFLQGDFGSGKSHFLAALYAWVAGGQGRAALEQGHGGLKRLGESGRKFLPVAVSLVNYRAVTDLEKIVVDAVSSALASALPADTAAQSSTAAPPGAAGAPPDAERLETFLHLIDQVQAAGYDGLLLLLDELSEFFRSKPTPQALNEDARALQLLGELAGRKPLWVVAAVQEAIEATGDVSQAILRKIKDRFPVRLDLSTLHVRALIAGRLVRRKQGADERIAEIHEHFRSQFSTFTVPFDEFRACYPVHPVTLSLLSRLGDLFSQHRGIVDFVYSRIAGDPQRAIPGILERPATELLGPDAIYDHFAPRLAEFSSFHVFPRTIVPHLDEVIESALESAEDRSLARRLVRMIVVFAVHPTAITPTVSQLAELAACSLGAAQPSLNARYVAEAILEPVMKKSRFLVRTLPPSGDPLQAVYRIAREEDPGKLLDARVSSAAEEIPEEDARLLVEPLSQIGESEAWPGAAVWGQGSQRTVSWTSSLRSALVRVLHGEQPQPFADRLSFDIAEQGVDFAFVIGIGNLAMRCANAVLWRVSVPKNNPALREYLALRMVSARASPSSPADAALVPLLKERLSRAAPAAFQASVEALYAGEFVDRQVRVDPAARQVRRFDRLLELAAESVLEERYPRFREVAPRKLLPSPRLYQLLLEGFVVPGAISLAEARSRSLSTLIDGLATPLGLVEIRRGSYVFSPDATGYPLIPFLFSLLKSSGPTPLANVLAGLRGSPFGLPQDTAVFLISALVVAGILSARKSGRAIPLDYVNMQSVEKAEEIAPGELISETDRDTLVRECAFLPSVGAASAFGLRQQRDAWKEVMKLKDSSTQLVAQVRQGLGRMAEFSSFQGFDRPRLERAADALETLAGAIKVSYQAKEGLEAFLRAWRGTGLTADEVLFLRKLSKFLGEKSEEYVFISHYLLHPAVERAANRDARIGELRAAAMALLQSPEAAVVSDGAEHLGALFAELRQSYGALYAREHEAYYAALRPPALDRSAQRALETLRLLSRVEALDVPAGLEAFFRQSAAEGRRSCGRRLAEELVRSPVCGCGFALEEPPTRGGAEEPEKAIDGFLQAYCGILASPRVVESVTARAFALKDVASASAERLRKLEVILRKGALSPAELVGAIDDGVISELGRALSGRIPIRRRSMAALVAKLAGRRLPPRTILSLVSDWLAETSEEALIAVETDAAAGTEAPQALTDSSLWPHLHGWLFDKLNRGPSAQAQDAHSWEEKLEEAFPSARLREAFAAAAPAEILSFIVSEPLHTAAVRAAWLELAARVLGGSRAAFEIRPDSGHADPEKARRITALLASLARVQELLDKPYPQRLAVRIPLESLLKDPWTTRELGATILHALERLSQEADSWLSRLPPVAPVSLSESPLVLIVDGIPPDVWLQSTESGWDAAAISSAEVSWARLDSPPSTQESMSSLFQLTGDPQEQLALRDSPLLTLKGDEARSLAETLVLRPGAPAVARLSLFDQAAHAQGMRLSEMAAVLREIASRDLPALLRACAEQGRPLILTTDHGMSLTREGLSHGRGGVYERLIFRARWNPVRT